MIAFSLFYFTYLHNFMYVYEFRVDTGGLAFPRAVYQTMTGIYFNEICLIGLFFIQHGARAQGIVMVVVLVLTVLFQIKLVSIFAPLVKYLPIDIQEELASQVEDQKIDDEGRDLDQERELHEGPNPDLDQEPSENSSPITPEITNDPQPSITIEPPELESEVEQTDLTHQNSLTRWHSRTIRKNIKTLGGKVAVGAGLMKRKPKDIDENEDIDTSLARKFAGQLTHDERVGIAFQHSALRARPPIIWIPDDELGIARDEIRITKRECGEEIEMTCEGATLDNKGKIQWLGNPPDYVYIPVL
jgi:calcium permeable stress-gated cation channel